MAACNGNGPFGSKLEFHAIQTVMPVKPTDPRKSTRVCLSENPISGIFFRCFNVLLCYQKVASEEEDSGIASGSLVAGWIRESLGWALSEQPMLAGRLRRNQDVEGELEMVSNDSGVRLIEAQLAMTLSEFLDLKDKKKAEAELVYWEGLDREQNPQFSPLFYVQVTSFKCGGYSIGISCSLLLVDPVAMTSFLKRWRDIHVEMVSRTDVPKIPIFYRPNLRNPGPLPGLSIGSSKKAYAAKTMIFTIANKVLDLDSEIHNKFAAACIDEAEYKLGYKTAPSLNFSFLVKEPSEEVNVRNFTREGLVQKPSTTVNGIHTCSTWDDLGVTEIWFEEGNRPAHVSCWINSVPDEALVMIIPSPEKDGSGMKIVVTLPH
ncbi:unnamed protein product [Coffea canephora]|uniref:Uncharacterized protein n=2 Tax=Coffea TaxID=13442 RepID=A0A068UIQ2_COFCA|nr:uncharacterized protein LOC113705303 [Coffea arabica]CDP08351.1 unnamed protein product [Coffea canephora]